MSDSKKEQERRQAAEERKTSKSQDRNKPPATDGTHRGQQTR